jgi:hypothetical protein
MKPAQGGPMAATAGRHGWASPDRIPKIAAFAPNRLATDAGSLAEILMGISPGIHGPASP